MEFVVVALLMNHINSNQVLNISHHISTKRGMFFFIKTLRKRNTIILNGIGTAIR
jgi:hypothetical protein